MKIGCRFQNKKPDVLARQSLAQSKYKKYEIISAKGGRPRSLISKYLLKRA